MCFINIIIVLQLKSRERESSFFGYREESFKLKTQPDYGNIPKKHKTLYVPLTLSTRASERAEESSR